MAMILFCHVIKIDQNPITTGINTFHSNAPMLPKWRLLGHNSKDPYTHLYIKTWFIEIFAVIFIRA